MPCIVHTGNHFHIVLAAQKLMVHPHGNQTEEIEMLNRYLSGHAEVCIQHYYVFNFENLHQPLLLNQILSEPLLPDLSDDIHSFKEIIHIIGQVPFQSHSLIIGVTQCASELIHHYCNSVSYRK